MKRPTRASAWNLADTLAIAGGLAIVVGTCLWSLAVGLVVAGLLLCVAAIATAPKTHR